jgi:putative N6-adenine-specific DNA methylase
VFGSDVAHRMVDFAQRNAERAGVAGVIEFKGGDALQRMPPCEQPGMMLLNPPYGERIEVAGVTAREIAHTDDGGEFFSQLASHWKKNYSGWTAWVLTPDLKLPGKMRLKESRKVPMWNGPIECRMFKFEMIKGSARK